MVGIIAEEICSFASAAQDPDKQTLFVAARRTSSFPGPHVMAVARQELAELLALLFRP